MPRPRKTTSEAIEDYFAEMPVSSQERMLDRLQLIHRLTLKGLLRNSTVQEEEESDVQALPNEN